MAKEEFGTVSTPFHGIFTALVSPMEEDGKLDLASLRRLVRHQLEQGIHGFYVGGSTGECFLLTREERKQLLETVIACVEGKATVIAHVGSMSTDEAIELAKHAESVQADAISAVVPFYYKIASAEIKRHYESIMQAVRLPMIIYHYPGATGVQLTIPFYEEMAKHSQCIGVKFTSLNLFEMQQIRAKCGDDFLIWNGHDEVYAGGALVAANGAIGSTFNIMPGIFTRMYEATCGNRWDEVRVLQSLANDVIAHLLHYDVIPYEKQVLHAQGMIRSPAARQPLKQFTQEERAEIRRFALTNEALTIK